MRKVLTFLIVAVLAVSMMVPTAFAAGTPGYTQNVSAGETVTVAFNVDSDVTLSTFRGIISTELNVSAVNSGVGNTTFNPANNEFNVYQGNGDVTVGAGSTLFTVTVAIPSDAKSGSEYKVSVTLQKGANGEGDLVALSGGTVTLVIPCDHTGETQTITGKPATCTETGLTDGVKCLVCGEMITEQDVIPALGHKMEQTAAAVAPDCVNPGKTAVMTCANGCGHTEGGEPIAALGHTPAKAVIENATDAVCDKGGSYDEVVYCSVCGEELSRNTVTVSALGHTPAEAVRENEVPATCKEAGSYDEVVYCSVCGHEISRTEKTIEKLTTHTPGEPVRENVVEATCKETGSYEEVIYCSVCGEEISRTDKVIEKAEHTPGKPVEENKVAATCSKKGSVDLVVYCTVCGEEISRDTQTIEKLPHVDENKDDKCDICGEDLDDDEPKNGDITPYPAYFLAVMMAVMAVAYGLKRKFEV